MSSFTQPEIPLLNFLKNPTIEKEISMFPETIGWEILFILLCLCIIRFSYKKFLVWKSNKYRRKALNKIKKNKELNFYKKAIFLSKTLKETMKLSNKKLKINTLTNENIFILLKKTTNNFELKKESFLLWQEAILRPENKIPFNKSDIENIEKNVIKWIKEHKKEEE